jgi:hypothetical protein
MSNKNIYLTAYFSMKPRPNVNTSVKGWMNDHNNLMYDEKVEIVRGLKPRTGSAKIILDFTNKTVVRNGFNEDRDFKKLFKYFFGGYAQYMSTVMIQLDPEWMDAMVAELEEEMKAADEAAAAEIQPVLENEVPSN